MYDFSWRKKRRRKKQLQGQILERESCKEEGFQVSHKKMRGFRRKREGQKKPKNYYTDAFLDLVSNRSKLKKLS